MEPGMKVKLWHSSLSLHLQAQSVLDGASDSNNTSSVIMPSAMLTSWTYRWWGISAGSTESRTKVNSIARQIL